MDPAGEDTDSVVAIFSTREAMSAMACQRPSEEGARPAVPIEIGMAPEELRSDGGVG